MARTYFITGTVYSVEYPDGADIDLEDLYDAYFNDDELPDGVEILRSEVTHFWEGGNSIMLGYTEEDVVEMMESIEIVNYSIINTEHPQYERVKSGLKMTIDFLQGILVEGYFD